MPRLNRYVNRVLLDSFTVLIVATATLGAAPTKPINVKVGLQQLWQGTTLFIEGKTNLPDGTKLKLWFNGKDEGWSDDCEVVVDHGRFRTKGFVAFENPVPLDTYTVDVQMASPSDQSAEFRAAVGEHAEHLTGKLVTEMANDDHDVTLETEMVLTAASRKANQAATRPQSEEEMKTQLQDMMKAVLGDQLEEIQISGPKDALNVRVDFNEKGFWSAEDNQCLTIACFIERKMRDGYQSLFTSGLKIESANIVAYMPGRFAGSVYATVMSRKVAAKVDWDNKASLDFRKIWKTNLKDNRLE